MSTSRLFVLLLLAAGCGATRTSGDHHDPAATASPKPAESASQPAASAAPAAPSPSGPERVPVDVPPAIQALVDATDRLPEDRALDQGRHPGEMLAYFGIAPGMSVAELGSGGGYTSELLARAAGPTGKVYGQNTKFILQRFAEKPWSDRLNRPVMKNVVRLDREFDDPLPKTVKNLDAVVVVLFYHDLYWMKVDRAKMNQAVLDALKPGGIYAIVDHSAKAGAAATEVQSLHRIEQSVLRADIEQAGFKLDREGFFLRNPMDTKDWSTSPGTAGELRGTSDRFVLVFKKPQ